MLIISPRVICNNSTDFYDTVSLLSSPRFAGKKGQDLLIALWEFMVDPNEGLYHYCQTSERSTWKLVWDAVKILNCFGWAICGQNATVMGTLFRDAGFKSRIVYGHGHLISEAFCDGQWRLLDGDMRAYHRKHPPHQDQIASAEEIVADLTLLTAQGNPSSPYYLSDRKPEDCGGIYSVLPQYYDVFADHSLVMSFAMRPGERLTKFKAPQGKWIWFDTFTEFKANYPEEWSATGPRRRHAPKEEYGNVVWSYSPNLTDHWQDFDAGVAEAINAAPTTDGIRPVRAGRSSFTFDFISPWPFAGIPGQSQDVAATDGCVVKFKVDQKSSAQVRMMMSVAPEENWFEAWSSSSPGVHDVRLDLTKYVVNSHRYSLRFELGDAGPESVAVNCLAVESFGMISQNSISCLAEGDNRIELRLGDAAGRTLTHRMFDTDFRKSDDVVRKTLRTVNLKFAPDTAEKVQPQDSAKPYEIIYKFDAPSRASFADVFVHLAYLGASPGTAGEDRLAAMWSPAEDGPWSPIFDDVVGEHSQRWHNSMEGSAELPPLKAVFVKLVGRTGLMNARIRLAELDERTALPSPAMTVEHSWIEADGQSRRHVEIIDRHNGSHREYSIRCGWSPELTSVSFDVGHLRGEMKS